MRYVRGMPGFLLIKLLCSHPLKFYFHKKKKSQRKNKQIKKNEYNNPVLNRRDQSSPIFTIIRARKIQKFKYINKQINSIAHIEQIKVIFQKIEKAFDNGQELGAKLQNSKYIWMRKVVVEYFKGLGYERVVQIMGLGLGLVYNIKAQPYFFAKPQKLLENKYIKIFYLLSTFNNISKKNFCHMQLLEDPSVAYFNLNQKLQSLFSEEIATHQELFLLYNQEQLKILTESNRGEKEAIKIQIEKLIAKEQLMIGGLSFLKIFLELRDYVIDIIKRKQNVQSIINQISQSLQKYGSDVDKDFMLDFSIQDLLILLFSTCRSQYERMVLGNVLKNLGLMIPLFYHSKDSLEFKFNKEAFLGIMNYNEKGLISIISTQKYEQLNIKPLFPRYFLLNPENYTWNVISQDGPGGYSRRGSVSITLQLESKDLKSMVALIQYDYITDEYKRVFTTMFNISNLVILSTTKDDILYSDSELSSCLQIYLKTLENNVFLENRGNFAVLCHIQDRDLNTLRLKIQNHFQSCLEKGFSVNLIQQFKGLLFSCQRNVPKIKQELMSIGSSYVKEEDFCYSIQAVSYFYQAALPQLIENQNFLFNKDLFASPFSCQSQQFFQLMQKYDLGNDKNRIFPFLENDLETIRYQNTLQQLVNEHANNHSQQYDIGIQIEKNQTDKQNLKLHPFIKEIFVLLNVKEVQNSINSVNSAISYWNKKYISPLNKKLVSIQNQLYNIGIQNNSSKLNLIGLNDENKMKKINEYQENLIKDYNNFSAQQQKLEISIDNVWSQIISVYDMIDQLQQQGFNISAINQQLYSDQEKFIPIVERYMHYSITHGYPVNIMDSRSLQFGSRFLQSYINRNFNDDPTAVGKQSNVGANSLSLQKQVFTISMIGAQSSAKSTLLNYLFGCGFSVSQGRCTKGIYFSLVMWRNLIVVVIDTQGLVSPVARDILFDNRVTTICLSISNVVIINQKGELNSIIRNLIQVCLYCLECIQTVGVKPQIIFALRDIANISSSETQEGQLSTMLQNLEEIALKLGINVSKLIQVNSKDVFLFSSAIIDTEFEDCKVTQTNPLFAGQALALRHYLFSLIEHEGLESLDKFYYKSCLSWKAVLNCGHNLLQMQDMLQIQVRDSIQNERINIEQQAAQKMIEQMNVPIDLQNSIKVYQEKLQKTMINTFQEGRQRLEKFPISTKTGNQPEWIGNELQKMQLNLKEIQNDRFCTLNQLYQNKLFNQQKQNIRTAANSFINQLAATEYQKEMEQMKKEIELKYQNEFQAIETEQLQTEQISAIIFQFIQQVLQNPQQIWSGYQKQVIDINKNKIQHAIMGNFQQDYESWIQVNMLDKLVRFFSSQQQNEKQTLQIIIQGIINDFKQRLQKYDQISYEIIYKIISFSAQECDSVIQQSQIPLNQEIVFRNFILIYSYFLYNNYKSLVMAEWNNKKSEIMKQIKLLESEINVIISDAKDGRNSGEVACQSMLTTIIDRYTEKTIEKVSNQLFSQIQKNFNNPEDIIKIAFRESFENENLEQFAEYSTDINKYIDKVFSRRIDSVLQGITNAYSGRIIEDIQTIIVDVEKLAKYFQTKDPQNTQQFLRQIQSLDSIQILGLLIFSEISFKTQKQKQFFLGFLQNQILQDHKNFSGQIQKRIEQLINQQHESQKAVIIGCQARCPVCGSKCKHGTSDLDHNHHAVSHTLAGFRGIGIEYTNQIYLGKCLSIQTTDTGWYHHCYNSEKQESERILYKNLQEMLRIHYPQWIDQLITRNTNPEQAESSISIKEKSIWMATKRFFLKFYDQVDKTPGNWDQIKPIKELSSNFIPFKLN